MQWIKAITKLPPKHDAVCRRIGHIDLLDSSDFHAYLRAKIIEAKNWEWLKETHEDQTANYHREAKQTTNPQ